MSVKENLAYEKGRRLLGIMINYLYSTVYRFFCYETA